MQITIFLLYYQNWFWWLLRAEEEEEEKAVRWLKYNDCGNEWEIQDIYYGKIEVYYHSLNKSKKKLLLTD